MLVGVTDSDKGRTVILLVSQLIIRVRDVIKLHLRFRNLMS